LACCLLVSSSNTDSNIHPEGILHRPYMGSTYHPGYIDCTSFGACFLGTFSSNPGCNFNTAAAAGSHPEVTYCYQYVISDMSSDLGILGSTFDCFDAGRFSYQGGISWCYRRS